MNANSTHETISRSIEPPLLLSGANYWAHRFRLRQQSDASSHILTAPSAHIKTPTVLRQLYALRRLSWLKRASCQKEDFLLFWAF